MRDHLDLVSFGGLKPLTVGWIDALNLRGFEDSVLVLLWVPDEGS